MVKNIEIKQTFEKACLYPIIQYVPFLRPLAGLFLSEMARKFILKPGGKSMWSEGLLEKSEKLGVSVDQAYREIVIECVRSKSFEYIPLYDAAYRNLKKQKMIT